MSARRGRGDNLKTARFGVAYLSTELVPPSLDALDGCPPWDAIGLHLAGTICAAATPLLSQQQRRETKTAEEGENDVRGVVDVVVRRRNDPGKGGGATAASREMGDDMETVRSDASYLH